MGDLDALYCGNNVFQCQWSIGIDKDRIFQLKQNNNKIQGELVMSKRNVPFIVTHRNKVQLKKNMSHATHTAKRHPNSKRVTNGSIK